MAVVCPKCNRKVISLNFDYCLYCKEPFDEEVMELIQAEKTKVDKEATKDFIRLQYEYKLEEKAKSNHIKIIRLIAVGFLILVAGGVILIASKILLVGNRMQQWGFSNVLYFSAIPITVIMLVLIGFMIYRILK